MDGDLALRVCCKLTCTVPDIAQPERIHLYRSKAGLMVVGTDDNAGLLTIMLTVYTPMAHAFMHRLSSDYMPIGNKSSLGAKALACATSCKQ